MVLCKRCEGSQCVKNGTVRNKQRYRCKGCGYNFILGDAREKYDKSVKNYAVRLYVNNCGFRRIAGILKVPLSTVFEWIRKGSKLVAREAGMREDNVSHIDVLELDELYTYVKKSHAPTKKQGKELGNLPEYGLLLIGTEEKLLRLR